MENVLGYQAADFCVRIQRKPSLAYTILLHHFQCLLNKTKYVRVNSVQLEQTKTINSFLKYREFLFARMDMATSQFDQL